MLEDKYEWSREEAQGLADFLSPMLDLRPSARASAAERLAHPWLDPGRGAGANNRWTICI